MIQLFWVNPLFTIRRHPIVVIATITKSHRSHVVVEISQEWCGRRNLAGVIVTEIMLESSMLES